MTYRFNTIYVHIGLGKTGSSSIQKYLHENAEWLESEHGLYFPCFSSVDKRFAGNHSRYLRVLFGSNDEKFGIYSMAGYDTPIKKSRYEERVETRLSQGIRTSTARAMLISAEGVGHLSAESNAKFYDWLSSLTNEIRIIACVRHPINALSSEIQQRLKVGQTLEKMYRSPPHYAFRDFFTRLITLFGKDSINLYDFDDAVTHQDGLIGAFLEQIDVKENFPSTNVEIENAAMSQDAAQILSALNRLEPVLKNGARNPKRSNAFLKYVQSLPGEKYQVPSVVAEQFKLVVDPHIQWMYENLGFKPTERPIETSSNIYSVEQRVIDQRALRMARYYHFREILAYCWYKLKRDPRQAVYLNYR